MKALIANLHHAARNGEHLKIGGGIFTPMEIREALIDFDNVVDTLDAAVHCLDEEDFPALRQRIREVLEKLK